MCFYGADLNIVGEQYVYAGQINLGYRVNDHLSVSAGLRANYVYNHYTADIKSIKISGLEHFPQLQPSMQQIGALFQDRELNCSQSGWGWTPVISVDYKAGPFNFAARYELNTKVRLSLGFHNYFDKQASFYNSATGQNDRQEALSIPGSDSMYRTNTVFGLGLNYSF